MSTEDNYNVNRSSDSAGSTDWVQRAQQQWKAFAAVAFVVLLAVAGYMWFSAEAVRNNEEANLHLSRIKAVFEAGEYEQALSGKGVEQLDENPILGLTQISEQYSGTDAGKVAALMAGNCHLCLGKNTEAKTQFEIARSSSAMIIEVGALQGLGACSDSEKDYAGAASLYEQAAQRASKSGLEEKCLFYAGICYEKSGDKSKAVQLFTEIVKRYEFSEVAPLARGGLARLGMAID